VHHANYQSNIVALCLYILQNRATELSRNDMSVTLSSTDLSDINGTSLDSKRYLIAVDQWLSEHSAIADRLCLEQNCKPDVAIAWLKEVAKFLFSCHQSDSRLTPSEKVDQAWHVFILFTYDYREFCRLFFGRFIDHYPGGETEQNTTQYELCLDSLIQNFGYADKAYWPRGISLQSEHILCGACSS
jgi:hypothetical protein